MSSSEHPSQSDEPIEPIDRYDLSRLHSEGGLGRVWLATDPAIGREVALKELLPEQAKNPEARARFLGEAQITGQLEHPNIVPIYDVGERDDDDRPYYTMRFVRGPTLADAIREDRVGDAGGSSRSRLRLLRALCSIGNAISHAHSRGIIHRDLKPENIVLGPHGELILLDWGLAKRIQDATTEVALQQQPKLTQTNAGAVMGTIAYMSPEQADGRRPDERTDIYGLGAILFEVLTGRPPHVGDDPVEVLRAISDGETPHARAFDPHVPAALDAICRTAMAKSRKQRYQTAARFVEELECWLADEPVQALPDTWLAGVARWVRRHQGIAMIGAAALLLVGIVATIAAVQLGAAAERERGLRERSIQVSARLAARALGSEIEVRWNALNTAAGSEPLRAALAAGGNSDQLQPWIASQFASFRKATGAVSWFVQDRHGVQVARAPHSSTSVGRSFAFRDYFHGGGVDLPVATERVAPIRRPHLSAVFQSQVTNNLMVAFTVPIREHGGEEVVGVLGMTVELGRGLFRCLRELGLDDNQIAVLVETRSDWTNRRGLVLQHPDLVRRRQRTEAAARASGDLGSYPAAAPRTSHVADRHVEQFTSQHRGVLRRYVDAVGEGRSTWLAAFETVTAQRFDDGATSWVVMIQEREGNP